MNELYPIFLKLHQIKVLIVGGGFVACEKLQFMLKSSPNAVITMVSPHFSEDALAFVESNALTIIHERYATEHLANHQLVIAATNDLEVNKQISREAKERRILVNVADTPDLCDFYLGGIVTKGNLKIAISTNGKSPTFAKRLRQFFEEIFPEDTNELLDNLNMFRDTLKGDFELKVSRLNALTEGFLMSTSSDEQEYPNQNIENSQNQ